MRINMNMDSYDINSLEEIYSTVAEFKGQCEALESCGIFIKEKIIKAQDEFTSINYHRVQEATEDYLKKLGIMRTELEELFQSCKQFAEKMNLIWS